MTEEQRFQGYSLGRNSSKVMAPPGGKSSISFGGPPEPQKPAPQPVVSEPAAAAPEPAPPANNVNTADTSQAAGGRVQQVDRFEKEHHISTCQMERNKSNVFASDTETRRQAVKIHKPPGGASSISFG